MKINQTIIKFISILTNGGKKADRFLSLSGQSAILQINNDRFVEVNEESILLLEKEDVSQRIFPVSNEEVSSIVDFSKLEKFCSEIDIVRLNHLGINYTVADINKELKHFKKLLSGTNFKLYEETSDNSTQRWFFIGNLENWEYPLFELVLNERKEPLLNEWIPHFQIDIDTNQSIDELKELTTNYVRPDFFGWELNIPNYGVVLAMGQLGKIDGTKIYLGMGTNLRDTKMHRNELLVEV